MTRYWVRAAVGLSLLGMIEVDGNDWEAADVWCTAAGLPAASVIAVRFTSDRAVKVEAEIAGMRVVRATFVQRGSRWWNRGRESYCYSSGQWLYYANSVATGVAVKAADLPAEIRASGSVGARTTVHLSVKGA